MIKNNTLWFMWFDADLHKTLAAKIERAAAEFERKHQRPARKIEVNPQVDLSALLVQDNPTYTNEELEAAMLDGSIKFKGMEIKKARCVLPHHFYVTGEQDGNDHRNQ